MSFSKEHLKEWYLELNTIDKHLETSASNILQSCDRLSELSGNSAEVDSLISDILTNCGFHDLNSQRLRKIVGSLRQELIDNFGEFSEITEESHSLSGPVPLQNGPQRPGKALSQDDIEALLKTTL